jgi:hypothetical protein
MCGYRPDIINNANDIVYQHFNQPDHSVLSMGGGAHEIFGVFHVKNHDFTPPLNPPLGTWLLSRYEITTSVVIGTD